MDCTDRIDLVVEDLKMQTGLGWLGIENRKCENEYILHIGYQSISSCSSQKFCDNVREIVGS
jgi:hypothetical protein